MTESDVVVIDPLTRPGWNDQLLSHPDSTIFHSANWARVLWETYGYRPKHFTLFRDGALKGCVPVLDIDSALTRRRGVSLSFSDSCGSLTGERNDFLELFSSIVDAGRRSGWRFVEFRGEPFLAGQPSSQSWIEHELLLSGEEEMFSRLRRSTATNIKKALREGVRAEVTHSLEGVLDFYRLHCLTRRRHGIPPQPFRFFKALHEHVIAEQLGFVIIGSYRGRPVAAAICLLFGRNAVFKYSASDMDFQQLRPTNLVFWEGINRCAAKGCSYFSMGRTEPHNEGLLRFKNGWGATQRIVNYHRYDLAADSFSTMDPHRHLTLYQKIFARLPVPVLMALGSLLYRFEA